MSTFTLEITMDNTAFDGDELGIELSRILRAVSNRYYVLDREGIVESNPETVLKDINGNTVGSAWIEIDEEESDDDEEVNEIYRRILRQAPARTHLARFLEDILGIQVYDHETEGELLAALVENIKDGSTDIEEFETFMDTIS